MPKLDKEAFSRFLRTGCRRQLRLYLYRADNQTQERASQVPPIPEPQPPRPGLAQIRGAGEQWAAEKLADLHDTLPAGTLIGDGARNAMNRWVYKQMPLPVALTQARTAIRGGAQGAFCVESEFVITPAFEAAVNVQGLRAGHGLTYAGLRTDLIEVRPPDREPATAVCPDGELRRLAADDPRLRLSVSEIKLQSEPSANYFAEVVLYAMVLAGWLNDQGLDDIFVVVTEGSFIWKGSTGESSLRRCAAEHAAAGAVLGYRDLRRALAEDVEAVPYEVFAPRCSRSGRC